MATLTIRNLPPEVVERLKRRARRHGRSMEQEAREILGRRLAARDEVLDRIEARWTELPAAPTARQVSGWIDAGRRGRA